MFPDQSRLPSPSVCALLVSGPLYKLRAGNTKAPVFMKCNHVIFLPLGLEVTAFHWFPLSFSSNAMKTLRVHPENSLFSISLHAQSPWLLLPSYTYIHLHKKKEFKHLINTFQIFWHLTFFDRAKANLFGSSVVRRREKRGQFTTFICVSQTNKCKMRKNNQTKNVMSIKFRPS